MLIRIYYCKIFSFYLSLMLQKNITRLGLKWNAHINQVTDVKKKSTDFGLEWKQPKDVKGNELARIYLEEDQSGDIKEIKEAESFADPGHNEIDTRFVVWTTSVKRGISPYLKKYLTDILDEARNTATMANESIGLPGLRELQTVALTAKMLVQVGNIAYDEIINILYPF